jgi:hypothetical protein
VEYEEVVHNERIPVERTITDYYAVETQVEYIPKEIEETIVEYEPVERTWERVQYLPVETQIVHYPEREKYVAGQGGKYIQAGYVNNGETVKTSAYQTGQVGGATTSYATGANYVSGGSGARQTTTTYVNQPATTTTYQSGYVQPTTTTTYQSSYVPAGTTTTYTTGGNGVQQGTTYVSGGSGVQQGTTYVSGGSGTQQGVTYVSGGSGVQQGTTYVPGGSGVQQGTTSYTYETTTNNRAY